MHTPAGAMTAERFVDKGPPTQLSEWAPMPKIIVHPCICNSQSVIEGTRITARRMTHNDSIGAVA